MKHVGLMIMRLSCLTCFFSLNTYAINKPLSLLWGKTAPGEVVFAPFGYHLFPGPMCQRIFNVRSTDLNDAQYLVEVHWKSIAVATFTNSYRDQVELFGLYRQIIHYKRFNLSYLVGVWTGYRNHQNAAPPLVQSVVEHDPGLLAAVDARVMLRKKLSFHILSPVNFHVLMFGIGYTFCC